MQRLLNKLNSLHIKVKIREDYYKVHGYVFPFATYLTFKIKKQKITVFACGDSNKESLLRAVCRLPPEIKSKL